MCSICCLVWSDLADFLVLVLGGEKDYLYTELWKACAGPLVDIPCCGEKVYYFPQGHMEQVYTLTFIFLSSNSYCTLIIMII